jgi:hypothetical protein
MASSSRTQTFLEALSFQEGQLRNMKAKGRRFNCHLANYLAQFFARYLAYMGHPPSS